MSKRCCERHSHVIIDSQLIASKSEIWLIPSSYTKLKEQITKKTKYEKDNIPNKSNKKIKKKIHESIININNKLKDSTGSQTQIPNVDIE